jgi:hypothetical protein
MNQRKESKSIQCLDGDFAYETVKYVSEHEHLYSGNSR